MHQLSHIDRSEIGRHLHQLRQAEPDKPVLDTFQLHSTRIGRNVLNR